MTSSTNSLSGVLLIDKPAGITSHDVVAQIRRLIRADLSPEAKAKGEAVAKAGHSGTLDPFATGLLIVAVGSATRLIEYSHDLRKTYEAEITLGATSDTDDVTGVIAPSPYEGEGGDGVMDAQRINTTLSTFLGHQDQLPPLYSAIKVKGRRMYDYARVGESVEQKPRRITIYDIHLLSYEYPVLNIKVTCSTGTYIRALARDIGGVLGVGGYASQLRRTTIGKFDIKKAVKIDDLTGENIATQLFPAQTLVEHLPSATLTNPNVVQFKQGRAVEVDLKAHALPDQLLTVFDPASSLVGIGQYDPTTSLLHPSKVLTF